MVRLSVWSGREARPYPEVALVLRQDGPKVRVEAIDPSSGMPLGNLITFYPNGTIHRHRLPSTQLKQMGFRASLYGEVATVREAKER